MSVLLVEIFGATNNNPIWFWLLYQVFYSKNTKGGLKTSSYDWVNEGFQPIIKRGYFKAFKIVFKEWINDFVAPQSIRLPPSAFSETTHFYSN